MKHLVQAWRCKSKMVGDVVNKSSNSGVGVSHETIGNQGIEKLCKDAPDSMMTRLVESVRGRVIGEVDCRLMWGPEPSTQGNCNNELGAKS